MFKKDQKKTNEDRNPCLLILHAPPPVRHDYCRTASTSLPKYALFIVLIVRVGSNTNNDANNRNNNDNKNINNNTNN